MYIQSAKYIQNFVQKKMRIEKDTPQDGQKSEEKKRDTQKDRQF